MRLTVTGTDTNVGKTIAATALTWKLRAVYWKPIQTGSPPDDDTATARRLTGLPPEHFHPPLHVLRPPLSPEAAALQENVIIPALPLLTLPAGNPALIVEGAGGALAPINDSTLMVDLFKAWALPVVVVASGALGTINHTLLTLEALRLRSLQVAGIIFSGGCPASTRRSIEHHGGAAVLGELPWMERPDAAALAAHISLPS